MDKLDLGIKTELEKWKQEAFLCAEEAFATHSGQVFDGIWAVCECAKRCWEQGSLSCECMIEAWAKESGLEWDQDLIPPEESCEGWAPSLEGREVPLMELLCFGIRWRTNHEMESERFEEVLYQEIVKNGYEGWQRYIAYLYLTKIPDAWDDVSPMILYSCWQMTVPQPWQAEANRHLSKMEREWQEQDTQRRERKAQEAFDRTAAIREAFHRVFGGMEPDGIRWILKELDHKTLAAGIVYAEEPVQERLWECLAPRQRERILEKWEKSGYRYSYQKTLDAMEQMLAMAGLVG